MCDAYTAMVGDIDRVGTDTMSVRAPPSAKNNRTQRIVIYPPPSVWIHHHYGGATTNVRNVNPDIAPRFVRQEFRDANIIDHALPRFMDAITLVTKTMPCRDSTMCAKSIHE